MAPALLILTLLVCIGPSFQQLQSLKPSETVPPGGTVTLSCQYSSGTITDGNYPWWAQQRPGKVPRTLIYATSTRPSGTPDRFSGSRSGNTMSLTITGALAEDETDYYCIVWTGSEYVFGGGTQLTLTGQPASPPTVNLFPPSAEERQSKNKATLVCLMDSFNPGAVTVTWQADGTTITSGVETTKPTKVNNKYMAASYLTMDTSEWERHEKYTCKVTHAGSEYPKAINRSQCA